LEHRDIVVRVDADDRGGIRALVGKRDLDLRPLIPRLRRLLDDMKVREYVCGSTPKNVSINAVDVMLTTPGLIAR
jgi:hypothetical protein